NDLKQTNKQKKPIPKWFLGSVLCQTTAAVYANLPAYIGTKNPSSEIKSVEGGILHQTFIFSFILARCQDKMADMVVFEPTRRLHALTHFDCVPFSQAWVLLQ